MSDRPENVWIECKKGYLRVMPPGDWIDFSGRAHYVPIERLAEAAHEADQARKQRDEELRGRLGTMLVGKYDEPHLTEILDSIFEESDQ